MALAIDPGLPLADIGTIKRMIPHRYPFLLIDRVVNIAVGDQRASASRTSPSTSRISRATSR